MTQLEQAIAAIKRGDKGTAKRLLAWVLHNEPRNEEAWLWLSYAVDDTKQKRDCLERVLNLNPHNKQAQKVLEFLGAQRTIVVPKPERRQTIERFEKPAPERTKKCPRCDESIRTKATVCRHCGHDFKKARTKQVRSILLAACAVAVCVCCALSISRTSLPVSQRTPGPIETRTTPVARTSSPAPADIADDLRIVIESNLDSCCPGTHLRGNRVQIEGRKILVMTSLDRSDLNEFYAAIGMIHGVVAEIAPDMSAVTIEDITGQQITVKMLDLLAFYNDQTTWDEYRATWIIVNP